MTTNLNTFVYAADTWICLCVNYSLPYFDSFLLANVSDLISRFLVCTNFKKNLPNVCIISSKCDVKKHFLQYSIQNLKSKFMY